MLRLSVALEEWLRIGEDINVVVVGINESRVKLMIDAPKDVPIARNRARAKYMSVEDYKKEQQAIERQLEKERNGEYTDSRQVDLYQWLSEGDRRNASYGVIGKGRLARECYNAIFTGGTQNILAYVNPQRVKEDCNVTPDEENALLNPRIDYIVVAVPDAKSYKGIVNKLRDMGISQRKIFWAAKL